MYQIPQNLDTTIFENQTISQIAFGLNTITIFIDKGFIQFSGSFSFQYEGRKFEYEEAYPVQNDYGLLRLLEKTITRIDINDERNILTLQFGDKINLRLIGGKEFESYVISINGKEVIV